MNQKQIIKRLTTDMIKREFWPPKPNIPDYSCEQRYKFGFTKESEKALESLQKKGFIDPLGPRPFGDISWDMRVVSVSSSSWQTFTHSPECKQAIIEVIQEYRRREDYSAHTDHLWKEWRLYRSFRHNLASGTVKINRDYTAQFAQTDPYRNEYVFLHYMWIDPYTLTSQRSFVLTDTSLNFERLIEAETTQQYLDRLEVCIELGINPSKA